MEFDIGQVSCFKKAIEDIVTAKIQSYGITSFIAARVTGINEDGTINVSIPPDNNRYVNNVLNKSHEELSVGDSVELCTKNGRLSNSWVALKHGISSSSGGGNYILDDLPIGAQFAYSNTNEIPLGCLICDGSAVSRTDYSELFAVIGTTYGEGDGSTTFNLPDKRGRVSVGLDATQSEFNALGKHIGEKSHTLTVQEMPNHDHNSLYWNGYGISLNQISDGNYGLQWNAKTAYDTNAFTVGATGGSQAHNNIQPSEVDVWLIKAKQRATNILPNATVYNGLDSTSTTNALSANMGNVLNNKFKNNMGNITVESINSKNLFNKNTIIGGWYEWNTGIFWDKGSTTFMTSDYIEVNAGEDYTVNLYNSTQLGSGGIMFYDANKNWIEPGIPETQQIITFTTPANAKYVRFVLRNDAKDYVQLEKGSEATDYTEYKLFDCTFLTEPSEKIFERQITTGTIYNFTKSLANYREICFMFAKEVKIITRDLFEKTNYFPGSLKLMNFESTANNALLGCDLKYIDDNQFQCLFSGYTSFNNNNWNDNPYTLIVYGIK